MGVDALHHGVDVRHHPGEVDVVQRQRSGQAEGWRVPRGLQCLGDVDEGLAGHAAGVRALPSDLVLLDHGHARPAPVGGQSHHQTGRSGAHHGYVVRHVKSLLGCVIVRRVCSSVLPSFGRHLARHACQRGRVIDNPALCDQPVGVDRGLREQCGHDGPPYPGCQRRPDAGRQVLNHGTGRWRYVQLVCCQPRCAKPTADVPLVDQNRRGATNRAVRARFRWRCAGLRRRPRSWRTTGVPIRPRRRRRPRLMRPVRRATRLR